MVTTETRRHGEGEELDTEGHRRYRSDTERDRVRENSIHAGIERRRVGLPLAGAAFLFSAVAATRAAPPGPADTVRSFYRYHFAHDRGFTRAALDRRHWLTAELYGLLRYERERKTAPDEVPFLDGDPFTDSQE